MRDVVQIIAKGGPAPTGAVDFVLLDHDMRVRRRIVFTTTGGERIRLNQADVVRLRDGDGLRLDDGRVVGVLAQPEPLLEITAHDAAELVRIAWHLGNRHLPMQFVAGRLRVREDHVIAGLVEHLGGHWRLIEAAFDPEGGAYAGGGHGHNHGDHGHEHA